MGHRVDTGRRHWSEPTADSVEDGVKRLAHDLMTESVKLGKLSRDSASYARQRAHVANLWNLFSPTVAQLRAQTTREAKQATKDAVHSKLCEIERAAEADPERLSKPFIAWKRAIDSVVEWLDGWTA